MNKELIQKEKEDKAIKFYTNYIENQEKELDWMYRQDEEYYRDEIEQKELLIKGFKTILNLIEKQSKEIEELKEKNKELEKYDYRKIKLDEKDKISSIHFTQEQLDLMNLGIALYVDIPKILTDKKDEETDI